MISFPGPMEYGIMAIVLLIIIAPIYFYITNLQGLLSKISEKNRMIHPDQLWYLLVPVVNIVYHFIVVDKINSSLKREFADHQSVYTDTNFTYRSGIAMCLFTCLIPFFTYAGVVALVFWILYWIKTADMKDQLTLQQSS
jgi:hypothetical protein